MNPDNLNPFDCPFCSAGCVNASFMESESCYALYNIAPVFPGHSLVIPNKHAQSLMELTESELNTFFSFARKVTRVLQLAFSGNDFDWSLQEGLSAGQSVGHLHLHIVIRSNGDLPDDENWYLLVRKNEEQILDSLRRPRISSEEHADITTYLRKIVAEQNKSLSEEE